MELAGKLAQLVRGSGLPGLGRKALGMAARIRTLSPKIAFPLLAAAVVAAGLLTSLAFGPSSPASHTRRGHVVALHHRSRATPDADIGNAIGTLGAKTVDLPAATAAPAAAPAALVSAPPLAGREDFAFAPYWTLPQSGSFSLTGLSTLDYFSLGVNPDGTIAESGPGWNGYESQALSSLITRAHAAGERVVLTVNDFGQSSLDSLTSSPTAPATLSAALIPLLQAKSLDGVNFDFEGSGSADQAGLTNLIASVSSALRAADPHWQITMDTYASSAGDPGGFYNIPALANSVDAFFVMAYELNLSAAQTAASALTSSQFSDATTLAQYTAVVPASKVIIGAPFFGINWPTDNGTLAATATGGATDIADSQVQSSSEPQYWDPITETGWTSYQTGNQWYESYFEDPYGLYQEAQLAAKYGVRGVGIWALGMEDNDQSMIFALDNIAPAGGPGSTGPASTSSSPATGAGAPTAVAVPASGTTTTNARSTTSPSTPSGSGGGSTGGSSSGSGGSATPTTAAPAASTTTTTAPLSTTATYNGGTVTLTPVNQGSVDTLSKEGSITNFQSNNPAYSCLNGKSVVVYGYGLLSGKDVVDATTPGDCITQEFTFPS
jgi:Glycosyl hydrolases family 18